MKALYIRKRMEAATLTEEGNVPAAVSAVRHGNASLGSFDVDIYPMSERMTERNSALKDLLTRFIEQVWNSGDIDASDRYVAPKYTIHHDPGDPWDKQELDLAAYKERLRISRAPFPDQRFTIQDLVAERNTVIMTWLWSGTHKGDFPGFPATGNNIKMSGATAYYFYGDRLTGHWQVTDRLGVYMQLRQGLPTTANR